MIMIPLTFLRALAALFLALREWFEFEEGQRNSVFIWFLCLFAFQSWLVGVRFGYGVEWLREIQPVSAAMLPPLAYLSFRERLAFPAIAMHLLPVLLAVLTALFANRMLDLFLAANNLLYGGLLAATGLKGSDGLTWGGLNRLRFWLVALWVVLAQMIYSGVTDGVIAIDYFMTDGRNTEFIVGVASLAGLASVLLFGAIAWLGIRRRRTTRDPREEEADREIFGRIEELIARDRLYLDPDLNLGRIARRLILPAREVSRAINSQSGGNVSQYVNAKRVAEACRIMREEGASVTSAIYASGFNTKSNFNREFTRVTGLAPSQWRQQHADAKS